MTTREPHEIIGRNIRLCRKAADLTQRDLAARAEISNTFLSDIERGKRNFSAEVWKRLAISLGVKMETLTCGTPYCINSPYC